MRISVIVPSNNINELKGFIESFKSMKTFSKYADLCIIYNGIPISQNVIHEISKSTSYFYILENKLTLYKGSIPFVWLRSQLMAHSNTNYFLFLDDDNRFPESSDEFFMKCYGFLNHKTNCSVLQADTFREKPPYKFNIKRDGFFWTGYSLFIKNLPFEYNDLINLVGACEDLLFAYEALNLEGLPYIVYGNPTTRDKSLPNDYKQYNNKSYSKDVLEKNIIGYIKNKYCDPNWDFYNNIKQLKYPHLLQEKIDIRINNEYN